jgi:hypothetical protein
MKFFNKDTRNQKCSLYNLKFLNLSGNSHVEDLESLKSSIETKNNNPAANDLLVAVRQRFLPNYIKPFGKFPVTLRFKPNLSIIRVHPATR